jgi:hypothetical protein
LAVRSLCSINSACRTVRNTGGFFLLAFLLIGCAGYTQPSKTPGSPTQSPSISLSSNSLTFNTVVVGQTQSQTLQIANTGNAPLQLNSLSVSNPQFSVAGPSTPATVLPAASLTYTVTFSPTAAGSASATLNIGSNASATMVGLSLSGTGEKAFANLAISPPSINFGNLNLKATGTQNVTLQNTGDISMTIQGITVAGAGFGYASLSAGFSLSPNQSVTFQVWFTPQVQGPASATVSFISPTLSSPATLSLSGDGITAAPPTAPPVQHVVQLNWNASSSAVIGYRVYRSETSGSAYTALTGAPFNALAYTDSTVVSGTTYYYAVTSVDAAGMESAYSNQVTAVVPTP